jgi:serine phosphatase RsbU (regulator of sigma subunit)
MRVRLADGLAEVVSAGHPAPFLLREGEIAPVPLTTQLPLGLAAVPYRTDTLQLRPGDRILMVTDGYLDRLAGRLSVEEVLLKGAHRHPRQVVQELGRTVREITGHRLRDDATALCLDWYGIDGSREATGGASRGRATSGG